MTNYSAWVYDIHKEVSFLENYLKMYRQELEVDRNCESSVKIESEHTINAYCKDVENLLDFAEKDVSEITPQDLDQFLKKDSPSTANRRLMGIINFYKFLNEIGVTDNCPIVFQKTFKKLRKNPRRMSVHMTQEEGLRFITESSKKLKQHAIMMTFLNGGMRKAELCGLKKTDFDLSNRTVRFIAKGNIERIVAIGSETANLIDEYLNTRKDDIDWLFISNWDRKYSPSGIDKIVMNIAKRAGITKKITPHSLRHTCAAMMRAQGNDILTIGRKLGQKDIKTTKIYLEHLLDERDIEAAENGAFNVNVKNV